LPAAVWTALVIPQSLQAKGATPDRLAMISRTGSGALLYISSPANGIVNFLTYPEGKLVGKLTGFQEPFGLCSDTAATPKRTLITLGPSADFLTALGLKSRRAERPIRRPLRLQEARPMRTFAHSRFALSVSLAATLAGCGGSQPPIGALSRSAAASSTVPYNVIYSFKGGTDGAGPVAPLIDLNGTLYGTTSAAGGDGCKNYGGCGTVFSITPSGVETVLHAFRGSPADGAKSTAGLVDVHGTLYGTTSFGGAKSSGTVFAITTSGAESVLHSFGGKGDGDIPQSELLLVENLLYGTTWIGGNGRCGNAHCGTVFTITLKGKERVLYSFQRPPDGQNPSARLLNDQGKLYSTTYGGGAYGGPSSHKGTVFTITPSGTETVLYSFKYSNDGAHSGAPLINVKGVLYGDTSSGGHETNGTIFSITTGGIETVLHYFRKSILDGRHPVGSLVDVNGTLYGTTFGGGTSGYGTIFSITTSGKETVLHSFTGTPGDGAYPRAGLVHVSGTLYGTTWSGGTSGNGTVFSITP
jgi:uncharacterized repeat protein (TIGR03803 family)